MSKLKLAGICGLALVVLVVGTILSITTRFGNNYDAQIEAMRAKGYPVTPAEFDAEPVADVLNAALVYDQIFQTTHVASWDGLMEAMEEIKQSPTGGSPEQWAEARRCADRCQPTIALLEQAVARPRCRFPRSWSIYESPSRHAFIRKLTQFCGYRAKVYAHSGDVDEAVRSLDLGYQIWHALDEEPGSLSYLVLSAVASIASEHMHDALKMDNLSEEQARRLYNTLAGIDSKRSFVQATISEMTQIIAFTEETARKCKRLQAPYDYSPASIRHLAVYTLYGHLVIRGDTAIQLEQLQETIDAVDLPYKEMIARNLFDEQDVPFYAISSKEGTGFMGGMHRARLRTECRLSVDMIMLSLAAYKDRHGEYPESLERLKSSLGWEIPKDPYGGEDFGYRRQGAGYILYTTGPDAEDDGGVQNSPKPMQDDETGDWVWEMKG